MADRVKLKVFRGTKAEVTNHPFEDGVLYFAYSGEIFLDKYNSETNKIDRLLMGSAGSGSGAAGYVYANATDDVKEGEVATLIKIKPEVGDLDDPYYYIKKEAFEESLEGSLPNKDTLIINNTGQFFRTLEQIDSDTVRVIIIAAAGTGDGSGGGGGTSSADDLELTVGKGLSTGLGFIYGQNNPITITAKCTRGSDPDTTIYITVVDETTSETVYSHQDIVNSSKNDTYTFNTNILPISDNLTITFRIDSNDSRMREAYKPARSFKNISVFEMNLKKSNESEYLPLRGETSAGGLRDHQLDFIATGARHLSQLRDSENKPLVQYLHVYIDDKEIYLKNNALEIMSPSNDGQSQRISIPEQPHGVHNVELKLETTLNGITLYSNSIVYQCAWVEKDVNVPIIWVGSYDPIVVKYEYSYIRYMVYDPLITSSDAGAKVFLYKNGEEISQLTVPYTTTGWVEWDITDLYDLGKNLFSISCRDQKIDLEITVTSDGAKNLDLVKPSQLLANYSASGRSNSEISSMRNIFSSSIIKNFENQAILRNFNWQNNGWNNDHIKTAQGVDNGSYLNIANGASVTIPIPRENRQLTLNGTSSYSFEIRFRIKNVQKYSTVVKTLAKYYYINENGVESTQAISEEEINEHNRTASEDAQWIIAKDEYGNLKAAEGQEIKKLEYDDGIVFKWMNTDSNFGFCLGTQEAFFQTQSGTVNVRYCEDEVINISFIVDITTHLCYIYLNGILSGAVTLPSNETNSVLMEKPFEINSAFCDFHLFRFRIYEYGLTMPEVIHNYLSDMHSILLYDQNQLARGNDPTELDFDKLVEYNNTHPNAVSMPYCTFEIEDDTDILPRYKGNNKSCTMNFVNPPADQLLAAGLIKDWQYYTSSPSYTAKGADINVQGTSSQKYPRRNWKTKLKNAKKTWKYTAGPLAGKPIADKNYYFDKTTLMYDPTPAPAQEANESDNDFKARLAAFEDARLVLTPKFHMDNESYGINKFTWKIDFMESSGSYNTGFANLMGNQGVNALYAKHPLADLGLSSTDYRTSVYGYPVLGFQKFRNPANNNGFDYRYIGRYNMNSDKSANEIYGFELSTKQPFQTVTKVVPAHIEYQPVETLEENVTYYRQNIIEIEISEDKFETRISYPIINPNSLKNNGEFITPNSDGTFYLSSDTDKKEPLIIYQQVSVEESSKTYTPKIKEIAECWELRDNQGTWCSFRYPSAAARGTGFKTTEDGKETLEVINHFEYRYSPYEDELDAIYANDDFIDEDNITRDSQGLKNAYAVSKYSNLEKLFNWLDSTDTDDPEIENNPLPETVGPWVTSEDYTYKEDGSNPNGNIGARSEPVTNYYLAGSSALYDENLSYFLKEDGTDNYIYVDLSSTKTLDSYRTVTVLSNAKDNKGRQKEYFQLIDGEYSVLTKEQITDANGILIKANSEGKFTLTGGTNPIDIYESYRPAYYIQTIDYYNTWFSNDTVGYRLYKFKNEFNKHLNKDYCLIYFIMTELLLCYDSRGKNMMMATFGPQEVGGEYIWYPIFYDIDTQLGLNNSGAYLWDYDEDVTLNNTFSTPNSVLWSNFYKAFYNEIVQEYRRLRVNTLSYKSIVGAYECDPSVFTKSLAMRGIRPTLAIGLDEYYKYIAPSVTGYYDTDPKDDSLKKFNSYPYAYACQGDKKLTTELLIQNRLNYLDSQWLAGAYTSATTINEVFIRANANKSGTSDSFFDSASFNNNENNLTQAAKRRNFKLLDYSINNGLDAKAGYKIKPFLHQYVTYFVDNLPVPAKKYVGDSSQLDGVQTNVSSNVLSAYKKTLDVSQQINYIPALDYISSLGDLSLSYPNAIQLYKGRKLLDLNIGSDNPEYFNDLLNSQSDFSIPSLPLLLSANFNHLRDFGKEVDLSASAKLQEFKAIDSTLTFATFAPGAPLHTVLLPKSITILSLTAHQNLTKILTHEPVLMIKNNETNLYEPTDPETYRGLYIQDVTDYNSSKKGLGHALSSLVIDGGKLEYDSYNILKNLIELKTGATSNQTLIAKLSDVHWSPYSLVVKNSVYDENTNYYELTDHGTYIPYVYNNITQWTKDLINEIVYTKDENAAQGTITDFSLFDILVQDYLNGKSQGKVNQFRGDIENASTPIITGDLFIHNDAEHPINEADLTEIWGQYFKNLKISADYITESNVTKYIAIQDNGKEETIDILRSNDDNPKMITALAPTKTNYDFRGWATDIEGNNMFITYNPITNEYQSNYQEKLNSYSFNENNTKILKLYAIFTIKTFQMVFYNDDGTTELKTVENVYSSNPGLIDPKIRPQKSDEGNLEVDEMYTWKGWATKLNPTKTVDLTTIRPTADMEFVAVYDTVKSSVHDSKNIMDKKYFVYQYDNRLNPSAGCCVGLNPEYTIKGKVVIPNKIDDIYVIKLGKKDTNLNFYKIQNEVTHIFFENTDCRVSAIDNYCFSGNSGVAYQTLKYVEPVSSITAINDSAFQYCSLPFESVYQLLNSPNIKTIGLGAFYYNSFSGVLTLPGHAFDSIQESAFGYIRSAKELQIGSPTDPCLWDINNLGNLLFSSLGSQSPYIDPTTGRQTTGLSRLHIYLPADKINDETYKNELIAKFDLPKTYKMIINDINQPYSWILAS